MTDLSVSDPNRVQETFISGPVNVRRIGDFVVITLTTARENVTQVFAGTAKPDVDAIVVSRLLIPMELARNIAELITKNFGRPPVRSSN